MPSLRDRYLFFAHEMAYNDFKAIHPKSPITLTKFETDGSDLSLLSGIERISKSGCLALLGLFTSRECLLVGPRLKPGGLFALSVSCSHSSIQQYYPDLLTAVPSAETFVENMVDYGEQFGHKEKFILNCTDDLYSNHFSELLKKKLGPEAIIIPFKSGGELDTKDLAKIAAARSPVLYYTSYPMPSLNIIRQINTLPTSAAGRLSIGSPSWSFDLATFEARPGVLGDIKGMKIPETWQRENPTSKDFEKRFTQTYGVPPQADAAYSYDTTRLTLDCLNGLLAKKSAPKNSDMRQCVASTHYTGLTGPTRFKSGVAFADKKIIFVPLEQYLGARKQ